VIYKREGGLTKLSINWFVYDEMSQNGPKHLIRGCTGVGDLAIAIFGGNQETVMKPKPGMLSDFRLRILIQRLN